MDHFLPINRVQGPTQMAEFGIKSVHVSSPFSFFLPQTFSWCLQLALPSIQVEDKKKVSGALGRWRHVRWVRPAWWLLSHGCGIVGEVSFGKKRRSRYKPGRLFEEVCTRRRNVGKNSEEEPGMDPTPLAPPSAGPTAGLPASLSVRRG